MHIHMCESMGLHIYMYTYTRVHTHTHTSTLSCIKNLQELDSIILTVPRSKIWLTCVQFLCGDLFCLAFAVVCFVLYVIFNVDKNQLNLISCNQAWKFERHTLECSLKLKRTGVRELRLTWWSAGSGRFP